MDDPLLLLVLLSGHLIGGWAIGATLRKLVRHGRRAGLAELLDSLMSILVWGGVFGCMPLVVGLQLLAEKGFPWLLPAQILVLGIAIAISFVFSEQIWAKLSYLPIFLMGLGGVYAATGLVAKVTMERRGEDPLFGLMLGGIFFAIGAVIFYVGWWQFMQERK